MKSTYGRRQFLAGSACATIAATISRQASATTQLGPHVHGLNGITLPLDRKINLSMRVLDGPDWQLQSMRGNVVFMNMFATWCGPCVEETPVFVDYFHHGPAGVKIVGVDIGEWDDDVRKWRKKFAVPYPLAMDSKRIVGTNVGLKGYPTTLIFRTDGLLSCAFIGGMDADDIAAEYALAIGTAGPDPTASPLTAVDKETP